MYDNLLSLFCDCDICNAANDRRSTDRDNGLSEIEQATVRFSYPNDVFSLPAELMREVMEKANRWHDLITRATHSPKRRMLLHIRLTIAIENYCERRIQTKPCLITKPYHPFTE